MPGSIPGPGQIVYSNGYACARWRGAEGAETVDLGIAVRYRRCHHEASAAPAIQARIS